MKPGRQLRHENLVVGSKHLGLFCRKLHWYSACVSSVEMQLFIDNCVSSFHKRAHHLCLIEASEMMEYSIPQPASQTSQHFVQKGIGMENIGMTATIILALKHPCCNCQLLLHTVAIILKTTLCKAVLPSKDLSLRFQHS